MWSAAVLYAGACSSRICRGLQQSYMQGPAAVLYAGACTQVDINLGVLHPADESRAVTL